MGAAVAVAANPAPMTAGIARGLDAVLLALQAQVAEVIAGDVVGPRTTVAERGAVLEAVGRGQPLATRQVRGLMDLGLPPRDLGMDPGRPWGEADRATILRLAGARGWSALAISVFVQRPEALVAAILAGARPERAVLGVRMDRRVPRRPDGPRRRTRKGGIGGR